MTPMFFGSIVAVWIRERAIFFRRQTIRTGAVVLVAKPLSLRASVQHASAAVRTRPRLREGHILSAPMRETVPSVIIRSLHLAFRVYVASTSIRVGAYFQEDVPIRVGKGTNVPILTCVVVNTMWDPIQYCVATTGIFPILNDGRATSSLSSVVVGKIAR